MHDEPIELLRKKIKSPLSDGGMFHTASIELNELLDAIEQGYDITEKHNNKADVTVRG